MKFTIITVRRSVLISGCLTLFLAAPAFALKHYTHEWSIYLGGSSSLGIGRDIITDSAGNVIVAGRAVPGFSTTAGAFQTTYAGMVNLPAYGSQNVFVFKFSANGATLMWSSYVSVADLCRDVVVDADGDIYLPHGWNTLSGIVKPLFLIPERPSSVFTVLDEKANF